MAEHLESATPPLAGKSAKTRPARRLEVCVVDEDASLRTYLRRRLTEQGYRVRELLPCHAAFDEIAARPPDLVLLSLDALGGIGPEAVLSLREISPVPLVAVSVRNDEDTIVEALANGADDYVKKPFGIRELLARIQSTLRRSARESGKPPLFVSGDLIVDLVHRRVWSAGREVHIPAKPYEVLRLLVEGAGKVLAHAELLTAVWGGERRHRLGYLRLAIREIRRHIEPDPSRPIHLVTEARVGYRLVAPRRVARMSIRRPASGQRA